MMARFLALCLVTLSALGCSAMPDPSQCAVTIVTIVTLVTVGGGGSGPQGGAGGEAPQGAGGQSQGGGAGHGGETGGTGGEVPQGGAGGGDGGVPPLPCPLGCPAPAEPCMVAVCVNGSCVDEQAPVGTSCDDGGYHCTPGGYCGVTPVVCATTGGTWQGCDGGAASGFAIHWDIAGEPYACSGHPAQHAYCAPGTPCSVVIGSTTYPGHCL